MSKFYGIVDGQARTSASRRGSANSGLRVSAQSWSGSLITRLHEDNEGHTIFTLEANDGSSCYGNEIFRGTLEELKEKLSK